MTDVTDRIEQARALVARATPDFLDKIAAHDCGASQVALQAIALLEALLKENDRRRICDSVGVGPSVVRVTGTLTTFTGPDVSTFVALPAPEKFTSGPLVRDDMPRQEDE